METLETNQQSVHNLTTFNTIINSLLLNTSFIDNLGIMHGKMGISILFFQLYRLTNNKVFEEYAGELIDEIYEELSAQTPLDFEIGLAGIGWGIEYLVQNGFIEADTDEVLEDFDEIIYKEFLNNENENIGLLNGLLGTATYFLKRLQNKGSNDECILQRTNKHALNHILEEILRRLHAIQIEGLLTCDSFDIILDYPTLIFFLAEFGKQNYFANKVEKLSIMLLGPLTVECNIPKQNSILLLLQLALNRLLISTSSNEITKTIQKILNSLSSRINHKKVIEELKNDSVSLRRGASGILWIYTHLSKTIPNDGYEKKIDFWKTRILEVIESNKNTLVDSGLVNDKKVSFGILEGYAGIVLTNII